MRLVITSVAVIVAVWIVPLLLSDESGLKFGWPYSVFFTFFTLLCSFFFYLLRMPPTGPFKSTRKAIAAVVLVFLTSTGLATLIASVAPQFAFEGTRTAAASAEERGKAVFSDPNAGCFLCHAVNGSGGTRGPDLTHVGTAAANRKPGMSAEDYLKESILNPGAYVVSPYDNIMPPFANRLSPEAMSDLIAYLNGLK
ncbi:MAG: cytochrome c [Chloroflexi bacterium]|nr:cytochrome c [Chloroflexota bacterium]